MKDTRWRNSEILLRDVALNFSPPGDITAIKRLRSVAPRSTQISSLRSETYFNRDVMRNSPRASFVHGLLEEKEE